jgi:hypothetical protein
VRAEALLEARSFLTEEQPWRGEWKNVLSNSSKLKGRAKESGGKFFEFENRSEVFDQSLTGRQMISAEISNWSRSSPLLAGFILFLSLIFLSLDFFFRKKRFWDA